jgi:HTH-type transcriptional regulator / antitoxin HipB
MAYPIKTLDQLKPILTAFRKQRGLSQTALADLLGITQQSYARIEANPTSTSVERLFVILRLVGAEIVLTPLEQGVPGLAGKPARTTPPAPATALPPSGNREPW